MLCYSYSVIPVFLIILLDTSQVLVSSGSMRKGSLSTRANGSATSTAAQTPGDGGENSTSDSTSSTTGTATTNGKQQKSSLSQKQE